MRDGGKFVLPLKTIRRIMYREYTAPAHGLHADTTGQVLCVQLAECVRYAESVHRHGPFRANLTACPPTYECGRIMGWKVPCGGWTSASGCSCGAIMWTNIQCQPTGSFAPPRHRAGHCGRVWLPSATSDSRTLRRWQSVRDPADAYQYLAALINALPKARTTDADQALLPWNICLLSA